MSARTHRRSLAGAPPLLAEWGHWRRSLFVLLNLVLFAGSCTLFKYLSSGNWLELSWDVYLEGLTDPLAGSLARPLGAVSYPWMIPVYAMLLAIVFVVPAMTAVLYGFRYAPPFLLLLALLGHAPALAVMLGIGCLMATRTPLKTEMPSCAVPLGLLPGIIYLFLFGFPDSLTAEVLPLQRWILASPMLIGVIGAVLTALIAMKLAEATRYRAGVIWPWALLLLAGAGAVFYGKTGPAELQYALITEGLTGDDLVFQPQRLEDWTHERQAQGLSKTNLTNRLRDDRHLRQKKLIERCEAFLASHKSSDRSAELSWLVAQCRSLQLDLPGLATGIVRYSASWPSEVSVQAWQRLVQEFPASPQAALGQWRLGQLALRQRDLEAADRHFQMAVQGLQALMSAQDKSSAPGTATGVLRAPRSIPSTEYYAETLFQAQRLAWLMASNAVTNDPAAGEALCEMLSINPYGKRLDERLGALLDERRYENTTMGDNLKLAVAVATPDPYLQADMLALLAADERTDAAIEANYHLGMLTMQTGRARALMLLPGIKTPKEYFETVIAAPPNPWQELSRQHLARVSSGTDI